MGQTIVQTPLTWYKVRGLSPVIWLTLLLLLCAACGKQPADDYSPDAQLTTTPTLSQAQIRPPDVAGAFYSDDAEELASTVDAMLKDATPPLADKPVALIAPHAGYVFSGPVAAYSFRQLEGHTYRVAVLIASDHSGPAADPIAVWPEGAWQTPLGLSVVDEDLAQALVEADARIVGNRAAFEGEHPLEVELPFLQRVCPQCRIVPILINSTEPEDVNTLADALIDVLPGRQAVIIASSDLSHYPTYEDAQAIDTATLDAIASFDEDTVRETIARGMAKGLPNLLTCACGEAPILVTLKAARGLGADSATVLHYANSGDVPQGNRDQVVGYGAVMFWQAGQPVTTASPLNETQRAFLLSLARETIAAQLADEPLPSPEVTDPAMLRPLGAFVTLKIEGELRGCIGQFESETPLYEVIQNMALAAAFEDPRFPPLGAGELPDVTIEISMLSPMHAIDSIDEIEIGRDGLLITKGQRRGVFLPQVPVEQGWDLNEYLEQLCGKAFLPSGCWREGATLYTFTAEVFSEDE